MRCADVRDLLHCFLDGELEVDRNVAILKHLELCAACDARAQGERRLREAVATAAREPLSPPDRRRIFAAVYASAKAPPPRRLRRRALLLAAAGLLVAAGGSFLAWDPYCWRGCPTLAAARDAYMASLTRPPVPAAELVAQGEEAPPSCPGLQCVGGVEPEAAPPGCATLLRYRCPQGRDMVFLRLRSGHVHSEYVRLLEDGRPYMEVAMQGMRVIAWEDGSGGVTFCMSAESVPRERLAAMARELRSQGLGHG